MCGQAAVLYVLLVNATTSASNGVSTQWNLLVRSIALYLVVMELAIRMLNAGTVATQHTGCPIYHNVQPPDDS